MGTIHGVTSVRALHQKLNVPCKADQGTFQCQFLCSSGAWFIITPWDPLEEDTALTLIPEPLLHLIEDVIYMDGISRDPSHRIPGK